MGHSIRHNAIAISYWRSAGIEILSTIVSRYSAPKQSSYDRDAEGDYYSVPCNVLHGTGNKTNSNKLPESKHVAGNVGVAVVEIVITHSSPDTAVVDLQTSCSRISVSADKSDRLYSYTSIFTKSEVPLPAHCLYMYFKVFSVNVAYFCSFAPLSNI